MEVKVKCRHRPNRPTEDTGRIWKLRQELGSFGNLLIHLVSALHLSFSSRLLSLRRVTVPKVRWNRAERKVMRRDGRGKRREVNVRNEREPSVTDEERREHTTRREAK